MEPSEYNRLKLEAVRRTSRFLSLRKFIDVIAKWSVPVMFPMLIMMPNTRFLLEFIESFCYLLLGRALIFAILDIIDCHFQRLRKIRPASAIAPAPPVSA